MWNGEKDETTEGVSTESLSEQNNTTHSLVTVNVILKKTPTGYGLQIRNNNTIPSLLITDVKHGSAAASSGRISAGDVILKVNDRDVSKLDFADAIKCLKTIPVGNDTVFTVRAKAKNESTSMNNLTDALHSLRNKISSLIGYDLGPDVGNQSISQPKNEQLVTNGRVPKANTIHNGDVIRNDDSQSGLKDVMTDVPKKKTLKFLIDGSKAVDTLHNKANEATGCSEHHCVGSVLAPDVSTRRQGEPRSKSDVIKQAKDFFEQYYTSINRLNTPAHVRRVQEMIDAVEKAGTYELTTSELAFGAKTAWRNAPRCIGRIQWSKLQVFDARHIRTARGMFEALCNHIKYATNKGNIRSAITIFPPRTEEGHDYRVWNVQLVRYAGYKQEDGTVIGDPANTDFTEVCQKLGWKGRGGMFDVLPLILQADGGEPELFEIPPDLAMEVIIKHPKYPWFEELGLRWYVLPAVSGMMLDCGGLEFTGIPFNGWYMGTEIGARDFCDPCRYNVTKTVAERMGLDVRRNASLWKDSAMVEVNLAVLYSFQTSGATITDHHTASESYLKHLETENRLRGGCPGDWVWIVPPMSGSLCPVFHQEMLMYKLKPSYEYQPDPWTTHVFKSHLDQPRLTGGVSRRRKKLTFKELSRAVKFSAQLMGKALAKRIKCTILYASETGRSEGFAKSLCQIFSHAFDAKVFSMNEYDVTDLEHETIVLIVASTFGNGDPPDNGMAFAKAIYSMTPEGQTPGRQHEVSMSFVRQVSVDVEVSSDVTGKGSSMLDPAGRTETLNNVRYSVFALGSSAYPNFCAFGRYVDRLLEDLGGERIYQLAEGDELCGQDDSFKEWSNGVFKAACETFCLEDQLNFTSMASQQDSSWSAGKYRLVPVSPESDVTLTSGLSRLHRKTITHCTLISRTQLQSPSSDRQTILLRLNTGDQEMLKYTPGDHVGIYPGNRAELVDAVLERVSGNVSADHTQLEVLHEKPTPLGPMKNWLADPRLPPCSLREALTRYLDLTTPPSPAFLGQLANIASDEVDRKRLQTLATNPAVYDEWRREFVPTLAEVLIQVPSVTLPATLLLSQLPRLQCRWYSISSAPEAHPGEIHITAVVINYRTLGGKGPVHHGVCSTWMNTIQPGETVPCYIRLAPDFHLPQDQRLPVIMVGPGTGIAPLRSFWHQRRIDMMKQQHGKGKSSLIGPMTLFFGCRRADHDDLYAEEKHQMAQEGVLSAQYVALSRQPQKPKEYVQDVMLQQSREVYGQIEEAGGHLYVCGDVAMASDVSATLERILRTEGGMTDEQSKAYLVKMRQTSRFHEDIFGATVGKSNEQKRTAKSDNEMVKA